jgi:hypothetical protein
MKNATMLLVLLTTTTFAACGGGDEGYGKVNVAAFTGVWTPTGGTSTWTCNGQSTSEQVTGTVTWTAGSSSDLVSADDSCVLRANIAGSTASLVPPSTCTASGVDSYGYSYTTTTNLTGYTFALGADKLTASESASATVTVTEAGQTVTCGLTETASYQKQ